MKPTWWLLYAIGLLLVGLLALVEIFVPRGGLQSILEITVVIGSFGLMALWLRHNRVAMELEEHDRRRGLVGRRRLVSPLRQVAKPAGDQGSHVASPLRLKTLGRTRRSGTNFGGAA